MRYDEIFQFLQKGQYPPDRCHGPLFFQFWRPGGRGNVAGACLGCGGFGAGDGIHPAFRACRTNLKTGKRNMRFTFGHDHFFWIPCWISWASLLVSRSNFSAPCGSTFDIPKLQSPVWPILIVPRETAHSSWFHFSVPLEMGLAQTMPASIFLDDFLCEKIVSENKHSLESGVPKILLRQAIRFPSFPIG